MGGIVPAPSSRRDRLRDHAFELAVMAAFLLVGLALLTDPAQAATRSPIGREVAGWTMAWALMYVIGCPTNIAGVVRRSPRMRVAGLALASGGMLMQFVAAVTYSPTDLRVWCYVLFGMACMLRAHVVAMTCRRTCRHDPAPMD